MWPHGFNYSLPIRLTGESRLRKHEVVSTCGNIRSCPRCKGDLSVAMAIMVERILRLLNLNLGRRFENTLPHGDIRERYTPTPDGS